MTPSCRCGQWCGVGCWRGPVLSTVLAVTGNARDIRQTRVTGRRRRMVIVGWWGTLVVVYEGVVAGVGGKKLQGSELQRFQVQHARDIFTHVC